MHDSGHYRCGHKQELRRRPAAPASPPPAPAAPTTRASVAAVGGVRWSATPATTFHRLTHGARLPPLEADGARQRQIFGRHRHTRTVRRSLHSVLKPFHKVRLGRLLHAGHCLDCQEQARSAVDDRLI